MIYINCNHIKGSFEKESNKNTYTGRLNWTGCVFKFEPKNLFYDCQLYQSYFDQSPDKDDEAANKNCVFLLCGQFWVENFKRFIFSTPVICK